MLVLESSSPFALRRWATTLLMVLLANKTILRRLIKLCHEANKAEGGGSADDHGYSPSLKTFKINLEKLGPLLFEAQLVCMSLSMLPAFFPSVSMNDGAAFPLMTIYLPIYLYLLSASGLCDLTRRSPGDYLPLGPGIEERRKDDGRLSKFYGFFTSGDRTDS